MTVVSMVSLFGPDREIPRVDSVAASGGRQFLDGSSIPLHGGPGSLRHAILETLRTPDAEIDRCHRQQDETDGEDQTRRREEPLRSTLKPLVNFLGTVGLGRSRRKRGRPLAGRGRLAQHRLAGGRHVENLEAFPADQARLDLLPGSSSCRTTSRALDLEHWNCPPRITQASSQNWPMRFHPDFVAPFSPPCEGGVRGGGPGSTSHKVFPCSLPLSPFASLSRGGKNRFRFARLPHHPPYPPFARGGKGSLARDVIPSRATKTRVSKPSLQLGQHQLCSMPGSGSCCRQGSRIRGGSRSLRETTGGQSGATAAAFRLSPGSTGPRPASAAFGGSAASWPLSSPSVIWMGSEG